MGNDRFTRLIPAVGVVLAATLLASCGDSGEEAGAAGQDVDEVTFALNWLPVAEAAGWYVAEEEGFFADAGLDVDIVRGFGSGDTVKRVGTGEVDFGVADVSALVPARLNDGVKAKAIGTFFSKSPHALFYRVGSEIDEPKDLEGKEIICSHNNANNLMFPVFAEATGIDASKVRWQMGDPGAITPAFAAGNGDAACGFMSTAALFDAQADFEVAAFSYAEHGVEAYAHQLIASDELIERDPDLVQRFVDAALRGLEHAIDNPDQALETLLDVAPENDPDIARQEWDIDVDHMDADGDALGGIDPARMEDTWQRLVDALELKPEETADDMYTTRFVERRGS